MSFLIGDYITTTNNEWQPNRCYCRVSQHDTCFDKVPNIHLLDSISVSFEDLVESPSATLKKGFVGRIPHQMSDRCAPNCKKHTLNIGCLPTTLKILNNLSYDSVLEREFPQRNLFITKCPFRGRFGLLSLFAPDREILERFYSNFSLFLNFFISFNLFH